MFALSDYVEGFSTTAKLNFGWYVQHLFLGLSALTSVEVIGSVSYACEAEMNDMFAGGSQKSQANGASNKTGAKRKILENCPRGVVCGM